MVSPNWKFWFVLLKGSLASQQGHALRRKILPALFCLNDNVSLNYNRKLLIRNKTSSQGSPKDKVT